MHNIDWKRAVPTEKEIQRIWDSVSFTKVPIENEGINEYIEIIKSNFGGPIVFDCFYISENEILDWYASRNRIEETGFFKRFLSSAVVFETFVREAGSRDLVYEDFITDAFKYSINWPLMLDGIMASLLYKGVYEKFQGSQSEAKEIGRNFCSSLFGERYDDIIIYESDKAWNKWFIDFIVDYTYLIIDKRYRKIYLICLTDSD